MIHPPLHTDLQSRHLLFSLVPWYESSLSVLGADASFFFDLKKKLHQFLPLLAVNPPLYSVRRWLLSPSVISRHIPFSRPVVSCLHLPLTLVLTSCPHLPSGRPFVICLYLLLSPFISHYLPLSPVISHYLLSSPVHLPPSCPHLPLSLILTSRHLPSPPVFNPRC